MESRRFDALTKHLRVARNRRAGLRLFLAGVAAGILRLATVFGVGIQEAPAKKRKRKPQKKKAARCKSVASRCQKDGDCCSRGCVQTGLCACSGTGNRCNRHSDCCSGGDVCSISACDNVNVPICCGLEGTVCLDRCDCCIGFPCIDGTCGGPPPCCPPGACCPGSGNRSVSAEGEGGECPDGDDCQCCNGKVCAEVKCAGNTEIRCCSDRESGPCDDDCDCCGDLQCVNTVCQTPTCLPDQTECPTVFAEPCCPPATECIQSGCLVDVPGVCPSGADSCAQPVVFCGGSPVQPQDCLCFLALDGTSFCSLGFDCNRECNSDADCADERLPGSRCIRCEATCLHDRGVCSSAACPT